MKYLVLKVAVYCSFCLSGLAFAETADIEDEERWYEIEILVYKSTKTTGLHSESWKTDTPIVFSDNIVDFLQPYKELTNDLSFETQQSAQLNSSNTPNNTVSIVKKSNKNGTQLTNEETARTSNQPSSLIVLAAEEYQLRNEAKSLSRHPDYRVLAHYGWRQPVVKSAEARPIRIAGGQDFSENYLFNGSKIIEPAVDEFTEHLQDPNFEKIEATGILQPTPSIRTENLTPSTKHVIRDATAPAEPIAKVALPWVPELDGEIVVYLNRYLHVKTNLFLRRADKEKIEVVELQPLIEAPVENSTTNALAPIQRENLNQLKPIDATQTQQDVIQQKLTQQKKQQQLTKNSQFSWVIDDNFLENESQKMYIDRLFNYQLQQSRRLRSGELHYFDHPMLGVLIIVRPFDTNKFDSMENTLIP